MLSHAVLKKRYKELKSKYDDIIYSSDVKNIVKLKKQNEKLKEENRMLHLKYSSQKKKLAEIRKVILKGDINE